MLFQPQRFNCQGGGAPIDTVLHGIVTVVKKSFLLLDYFTASQKET